LSEDALAVGSADYELKPDRALQGGTRGVQRVQDVIVGDSDRLNGGRGGFKSGEVIG
jgi:hypothetical protein